MIVWMEKISLLCLKCKDAHLFYFNKVDSCVFIEALCYTSMLPGTSAGYYHAPNGIQKTPGVHLDDSLKVTVTKSFSLYSDVKIVYKFIEGSDGVWIMFNSFPHLTYLSAYSFVL